MTRWLLRVGVIAFVLAPFFAVGCAVQGQAKAGGTESRPPDEAPPAWESSSEASSAVSSAPAVSTPADGGAPAPTATSADRSPSDEPVRPRPACPLVCNVANKPNNARVA